MTDIRFSVIIPIYNTEKYLHQCIDSVVNQQYPHMELILVNDGSTDRSGIICHEYEAQYPFVVCIDQKNAGDAAARNIGMQTAGGEYILFLDSDDWMCSNLLQELNTVINQTGHKDVYYGNYIVCREGAADKPVSFAFDRDVMDRGNAVAVLEHLFCGPSRSEFSTVWRTVFKREIIASNALQFANYTCGEDRDFVIRYTLSCKQFGFVEQSLVHFRIFREGSITNTASIGHIRSRLQLAKKWHDYFYNLYSQDGNQSAYGLARIFANKLLDAIQNVHLLPADAQCEVKAFLEENRYMLQYVTGKKHLLAKWMLIILGFRLGTSVLYCIYRTNNRMTIRSKV